MEGRWGRISSVLVFILGLGLLAALWMFTPMRCERNAFFTLKGSVDDCEVVDPPRQVAPLLANH